MDAPPERVLEEFAARDALRGREIRWEGAGADSPSGAGRAEGIDERGNLLVATDDGRRLSLGAGEVQLALRSERPALAAAAASANHRDRERQRHQQHPGQVDRRAPGDPPVPDLERPRRPHHAAEAHADAALPLRLGLAVDFDGCRAPSLPPPPPPPITVAAGITVTPSRSTGSAKSSVRHRHSPPAGAAGRD